MDKTAGTDLVSEVKEYQSSIAQNLSVNVDCVRCECFTVLSRDRSRFHLAVLEAVKFTHNLSCESKNNA